RRDRRVFVVRRCAAPLRRGGRHQLRDRAALSPMAPQSEPLPSDFAEAFSRVDLGRFGRPALYFSTIGSTNDIASMLANSGEHEGAVVIAETQTAGRGRRGRVWFSPPGAGLYVSVVLMPARSVGSPE